MNRAPLIAVLLVALGLPAWALPRPKDRWICVETEHFTLFSAVGAKDTRRLGNQVGKLKQVLDASSVGMETYSPLPTFIYVFKNNSAFREYTIGLDGRPENIVGFFIGGDDANYVAINAGSGERPEEVIFHEYVHYWLDNNVPTAPLWLGEGLAEYYSTFHTRANLAEIGRYVTSHALWLTENTLIPVDKLLAADSSSPDYHEDDRVGLFYAQSWAAVHYLMSDKQRRARLGEYFKRINASEDPVEAFQATWGMTAQEFQANLDAYIGDGTFPYYRLTFENDLEDTESETTPMERATVLARLGDLMAHNPPIQFDATEEHLRAALELDGELGVAWATLGYLDQLRGRDAEAGKHFEKAIAHDPDNARTHRLHGLSLLERFEDSLETGFETYETPPPMLARARSSFSRSLELDPGNPPSLVGLARTYVYEPDSEETLYAIQQGLEAMPSRTDLLFDLVVVSAHRGNLAGARRILDDSLRPRGETSMVRSAEGLIASVTIDEAFSLADGESDEAAIALLQEAAERTTTRSIRRQLLAQATTLGVRVVEGEDLALYEEALAEANQGNFEAATRILDGLIGHTDQPALRRIAEAQREAIAEIKHETENITLFNRAITLANDHKFKEALVEMDRLLARDIDDDLRAEVVKVRGEIQKVTAP